MHKKWFYMSPEGGEGGGGGGTGSTGGNGNPAPQGGNFSLEGDGFRNAIPEEFRNHSALAPIKDFGGLVKGFVHAQSLVGADKIVLPKEPDSKDWGDVWKKLGRPDSADQYDFSQIMAGVPKELPITDDDSKFVKSLFHEAGLTKKQAEQVYGKYLGRQAEQYKKAQDDYRQAVQVQEQRMRQQYGDQYDVKVAMARNMVNALGGSDFANFLNQTGLGDHPQLVNIFIRLGELAASDPVIRDKFASQGHTGSKDEAMTEIAKLNADPNFMKAYTTADDPGHVDAVKRMERLYAMAFPGKTAAS